MLCRCISRWRQVSRSEIINCIVIQDRHLLYARLATNLVRASGTSDLLLYEYRHSVDGTLDLNLATTLVRFTALESLPRRTCRKIDCSLALTWLEYRRHQILGTIHLLIFDCPRLLVLREVVEDRSNDRRSLFMGFLHETSRVFSHIFSDLHVFFADLIDLWSVRPDLVRSSRQARCAASGTVLRLVRFTISVQAHHRAECSVLEPSGEQLAEGFVVGIATMETANVGGPPTDACHAHVESGSELVLQTVPRRGNISAPYQSTVLLTTSPCASKKIDDVLLSCGLLAFIEGTSVFFGVDVTDADVRSFPVSPVVKVIDGVLGLGFVQPECLDSLVEIVLLCFIPNIGSGLRVGGIEMNSVTLEVERNPCTAIASDQETLLHHLFVVLTSPVDGRPDRHHQLDVHLLQLFHHGIRIRPVGRVKLPFSLQGPMEEVDHDEIDRQLTSFVFSCNVKQFFLCLIAKLALPEAETVLRYELASLLGGNRAGNRLQVY